MNCTACRSEDLVAAFTASDINDRSYDYLSCKHCGTLQISHYDTDLLNYAYGESYYGGDSQKFKWPFSKLFGFSKQLAVSR